MELTDGEIFVVRDLFDQLSYAKKWVRQNYAGRPAYHSLGAKLKEATGNKHVYIAEPSESQAMRIFWRENEDRIGVPFRSDGRFPKEVVEAAGRIQAYNRKEREVQTSLAEAVARVLRAR